MTERVTLQWVRSRSMTEAREVVGRRSCVYVQTNSRGRPVRVGKASRGLHVRYRGGTGWALDAAMHESGNFVYTALVPEQLCKAVEDHLVWQWRDSLPYNIVGKIRAPPAVSIRHAGNPPRVR